MKDDRLISLNAAIDAMMKLQTEDIEAYGASIPEGFDGDRAVTAIKALPSATDTNVGGNLIDRQAAISEIMEDIKDRSLHDDPATPEDYAEGYDEGIRNAAAIVLRVPSVQPNFDEWCDDCKEYDKERHSCPRWNRVIRETVEDMKAAQPGWIPWDKKTRNSMKYTLQTLYRLAYNIHGVMDAIDDDNVKRLIALLEGGQDE